MISRLDILNFQSIAHAHIELGDYTALVGSSDVGKSAVLRALYALCTNPRGDYFVRNGERDCVVEVRLTGGGTVAWRKVRGRSGMYVVRTPEGDETEYSGAAGVPDAVRRLLPVTLQVGDDESLPGFAKQHDPPFLFADTPRRRAQVLGAFDGSTLLLGADGALRRGQREAQQALSRAEAEAQAAREAATAFSWLPGAQDAATEARRALGSATEREDRLRAATALLEALEGTATAVEQITARVAAMEAAGAPEALVRAQTALNRAAAIEALGREVATVETQYQRAGDEVAAADEGRLAVAEQLRALVGSPCPTCGQPMTAEGLAPVA